MRTYLTSFSNSITRLLLIVLLALCSIVAYAQDAPLKKVTTSGFVDFYYSNNFAQPTSHLNKFRNFDTNGEQFNISLAELVFQQPAEPVGFRIDADFGPTNDLVQTGNAGTFNYLQQAYLTAVLPVGKGLTIDAGKFVTHMGFEVIESKDNWNYSRSLLFAWAIPYFHVGARASYPLLSDLTVTGHVCNAWNSIGDNNTAKTFGATLNYLASGSSNIIFNWIGGSEKTTGSGNKNVFDLILIQQLGEAAKVALNADYGEEKFDDGTRTWKGIALYGRYAFSGTSALALRGEVFSDPQGFTTGVGQDLKELTATYEYLFSDALLLRAEYRRDWSNTDVFDKKEEVNIVKYQDTFSISGVIIF